MGRHSSPEQGPFYRSIIGWLLPWFMIAAVVLIAVIVAVDAVGGDDLDNAPVARNTEPDVQESPTIEETPIETPTPEKTPKPDRPPPKEDEKVALITDGVTVQVLNGTGVSDADDRMADRLSSLGYEVVAIDSASKHYGSTTVFWSFPGAQDAAEALAEKFGWIAQLKPSNLSSTVDLHVVVGSDEA